MRPRPVNHLKIDNDDRQSLCGVHHSYEQFVVQNDLSFYARKWKNEDYCEACALIAVAAQRSGHE